MKSTIHNSLRIWNCSRKKKRINNWNNLNNYFWKVQQLNLFSMIFLFIKMRKWMKLMLLFPEKIRLRIKMILKMLIIPKLLIWCIFWWILLIKFIEGLVIKNRIWIKKINFRIKLKIKLLNQTHYNWFSRNHKVK